MKPQIQVIRYRIHKLYATKTIILSLGLILISILGLSCLSSAVFEERNTEALAQSYVQTIKYRNLVLDLGNGVKTKAQLTYPAVGKGPFPAVLLVQGSGSLDMNETLTKNAKPFWQIAQYLSERGFAVLRYDKRGVGANDTILDPNVWGNTTINDLIHDAEKALNVLMQQPEVDSKRISIIGHSEGTTIAPRVAIDNSTKVKNILLMGVVAQNSRDTVYYQNVYLPTEYATQILDKNHTGFISIKQMAKDPFFIRYIVPPSISHSNNTKAITTTIAKYIPSTNGYVSIDRQLRPPLIKAFENYTALKWLDSKCNNHGGCPLYFRSVNILIPTLSVIGNVSKSTGILLLNGENDSQTPVQQAFLLQQRLTNVNHPDHTLITYPNLGHAFYPSSQWSTGIGPIEPYVLADLYSWLESHSGFTQPSTTAAPGEMSANKSLFTNSTSNSSSSSN